LSNCQSSNGACKAVDVTVSQNP